MNNPSDLPQELGQFIETFKDLIELISIDGAYRLNNIGWTIPARQRNEFEFLYIYKGTAKLTIHQEQYIAEKGDFFFIDNAKGIICESGHFTLFFCTFTLTTSLSSNAYLQLKAGINRLQGRLILENSGTLEKSFLLLLKEFNWIEAAHKLNTKLLALRVFIELLRNSVQAAKKTVQYSSVKHAGLIHNIINAISENYQEELTLEKLAANWKLNPRYLNLIFKASTGLPIFQYRQRMKIELAKRMLQSQKVNIMDITYQLGFANSQHFSRVFKQITGLTPSEFKRT